MRYVKLVMAGLLLFGLFSCEDTEDDTTALIGKWVVTGENASYYVDGEFDDSYSWDYNPTHDNYFSAVFYEITDSKITFWKNLEGGSDYYTEEMDYDATKDEITVDGESVTWSVSGDELIFSDVWTDGTDREVYEIIMTKYTGTLPPSSWTNPLAADQYEDDDNSLDATVMSVPTSYQVHTITTGDEDWFTFTGTAGKTYMILVTGNMDNVLFLFDSQYNELADDDDNDYYLDIPEAESVIVWDCPASGTYYFAVIGYGYEWDETDHDTGYYTISLSETTMDSPLNKMGKRTEKPVRPLLPFVK